MKQFQNLIEKILTEGELVPNRTGTDTICLFGEQMKFDLSEGFPAVTTKQLFWKPVVSELLWFLEGSSDERRLAELNYGKPRSELKDKTTIWTANANQQGVALGYKNTDDVKELGPVYGRQWRRWNHVTAEYIDQIQNGGHVTAVYIDQIKNVLNSLKNNPNDRRIILSAWNVSDLEIMALPPCHCFAQFRVLNYHLHCHMYIRSNDIFLGAPFNIASYALLTHILAREAKLLPGTLTYTIGDAHIYEDHIEQCKEMLNRDPLDLPKLEIAEGFNLNDIFTGEGEFTLDTVDKFKLVGYEHHGPLRGKMAV